MRLLVDGAEYFDALLQSLRRAQHSIFFLGWDFDTRVRLSRDASLGSEFRTVLQECARANPRLRIYILAWAPNAVYAAEREILMGAKMRYLTGVRIRFRFDNQHPPTASHHQKVVVVDDRVAYVGGIDVTQHRWDTPAHQPEDARRRRPNGQSYPPFHDLQAVVDGDVARVLGHLARERWEAATGERVPMQPPSRDLGRGPWPQGYSPEALSVAVGIIRTAPTRPGQPGRRETEEFLLRAIHAARHYIYAESQYITSRAITSALVTALRRSQGPEVLLVLPRQCSGWMERLTMGVLSDQQIAVLMDNDHHGRLSVASPLVEGRTVYVHSKFVAVDDRYAYIGSANLADRCLGLDTEVGLGIEATNARESMLVDQWVTRLLAEHLGVTRRGFRAHRRRSGSLLTTVRELSDTRRGLHSGARPDSDLKEWLPISEIFRWVDPPGPLFFPARDDDT